MERIVELVENLKGNTAGWAEVFRFACSLARALANDILERLGGKLMQEKEGNIEVVASKEHWLTTILGDIRVKTRLYRDKDGNYRFLLDERMGLDKGSHVSPKMKQLSMTTDEVALLVFFRHLAFSGGVGYS